MSKTILSTKNIMELAVSAAEAVYDAHDKTEAAGVTAETALAFVTDTMGDLAETEEEAEKYAALAKMTGSNLELFKSVYKLALAHFFS
jgi:hypothetical protein